MSGKCSICLSTFKEPVSIPCGHVYCTKCLADHVNTPGRDDTTSSCPTCRAVFNIVTPDLTYLPKKYHQYVVPGVRRVYLDTSSGEVALQKKLTKAEGRIRKLEAEQETLLKRCEQYMSATHAHAEGEVKERQRANKHKDAFNALSAKASEAEAASEAYIKELEQDRNELKMKYQKLKLHFRDIEHSKSQIDVILEYEHTPPNLRMHLDDSLHNAARYERKIRPLPRKRGPVSHSDNTMIAPISSESSKRARLSAPGQL